MLIGGDDISNDVITLGTCFSMFVDIRARFRLALIGGNLTAQSTGSHRGIGHLLQEVMWHHFHLWKSKLYDFAFKKPLVGHILNELIVT